MICVPAPRWLHCVPATGRLPEAGRPSAVEPLLAIAEGTTESMASLLSPCEGDVWQREVKRVVQGSCKLPLWRESPRAILNTLAQLGPGYSISLYHEVSAAFSTLPKGLPSSLVPIKKTAAPSASGRQPNFLGPMTWAGINAGSHFKRWYIVQATKLLQWKVKNQPWELYSSHDS